MSGSLESSVHRLEEQTKIINTSLKESKNLISGTVDGLVGIFGGETVRSEYERQLQNIHTEARKVHQELIKEIERNPGNTQLRAQGQLLHDRLQVIAGAKLEGPSLVQMMGNTDFTEAGKNALHGVKGEVIGIGHGLKTIITGSADLAVFMEKYAFKAEYRNTIDKQAGQIYDFIEKEGMTGVRDKVFEVIQKEIDRISKLPPEKQAEAMGNIAGNVIAMLVTMRAGMALGGKISKMSGKVGQAKRIGIALAERGEGMSPRALRVAALGKQAGNVRLGATVPNIIINGIGESLIGYAFAKGLGTTLFLLKSTVVSSAEKLSSINKTLTEMEIAMNLEKNPEQKKAIEKAMGDLRKEKVKLERPETDTSEISRNALLDDASRLQKAKEILGRDLTPEQKQAILKVHHEVSKGIYANDFTDIRKMTAILRPSGLSGKETRLLMEKGVLGSGTVNDFLRLNNGRSFDELLKMGIPKGKNVVFYAKEGFQYGFEGLGNGKVRMISTSNKNYSQYIGKEYSLHSSHTNIVNVGKDFHTGTIGRMEIDDIKNVHGFSDWRVEKIQNSAVFDSKLKKITSYKDSEGTNRILTKDEELYFGPRNPESQKPLPYIIDRKNHTIRIADREIEKQIHAQNKLETLKYGPMGAYFGKLFALIERDFPEISSGIYLYGKVDKKNYVGCASYLGDAGVNWSYKIHVDMENGLNRYNDAIKLVPKTTNYIFKQSGLILEDYEKAGLIATHVFFHELGHIVDIKKIISRQHEALEKATGNYQAKTKIDKDVVVKYSKDPEMSYRYVGSEFNADQFAFQMIKKYEKEIRAYMQDLPKT